MASKGQVFYLKAQFKTVNQYSLTPLDATDVALYAARPGRGLSRRARWPQRNDAARRFGGSVPGFAANVKTWSSVFDDNI